MKKLTVVMPYLNEGYEPLHTLQSICSTTELTSQLDFIIIDDNSTRQPDDLHDKLKNVENVENVKVFRNNSRLGLPACRDMGVKVAETDNILIIDAHMRFRKDDWVNKINNLIASDSKTLWCTTCPRLNSENLDMIRPRGKYYGANLVLIDRNNEKERPARNIIEPKWRTRLGVGYELPCILGANYFFSKKWWEYIRGWEGLKMWGTSEPFISIKSWLAGGKCKITTDIEIGHIFRKNAPYVTQTYPLFYNKIFTSMVLFEDELGEILIKKLHKNRSFYKAMEMIEDDRYFILSQKNYYNGIFKMSFEEYCDKFNVDIPRC